MSARILDGLATAKQIREEIKAEVEHYVAHTGMTPHLAVLQVGDDPASHVYVNMKKKACTNAGMLSTVYQLPADTTQEEIVRIIELLDRYEIPILGKHAVVVGRSIILGKPVAIYLLNRHATVTICHTRTRDLGEMTRQADILVAAAGKAEMITGDMIKDGAVIIDAGYNKVEGRQGDVGDVDFAAASEKASWITPVPGGVGPMTIAMLLKNTMKAAESAAGAGE